MISATTMEAGPEELGPVMLNAAFRGVSRHRTRAPGEFSLG